MSVIRSNGRSVAEWVGATPDTPVPKRVKLRVFEAYDGRCWISGKKIRPGDKWEIEHRLALCLGGENREANLAPALATEHKSKTRADVALKSKIARTRLKHLGLYPPAKQKIRSRGFDRRWNP